VVTDATSTEERDVGEHVPMGRIVVAGSGVGGLAAAMVPAGDDHLVAVLEHDPAPPPPDPHEVFGWDAPSRGQLVGPVS
jgi:2-polyprenyl-6-methoxyphenol hydroxylase-like FAD-dependent oxidoreductase